MPANRSRAWSLISMGTEQQYAGNQGYLDESGRVYRYDSHVANHKNVLPGDLVFIRDRTALIGCAIVERVASAAGKKTMRRCPECGLVDLKERKTMKPRFRCSEGHQFDAPREEIVDVTNFDAHYENTFISAPRALSARQLKAAAIRPSDQLAIEEVNPGVVEAELIGSVAGAEDLFARFFHRERIAAEEAEEAAIDPAALSDYKSSLADTRRSTLRSIKVRRGQRKFRNALIKAYGQQCLVTGCELPELLEAAHIWPYRGEADNHVANGLLLRTDIHTLFDLDLLGVDPVTLRIQLARGVRALPEYAALDGSVLRVRGRVRPSQDPLELRWRAFAGSNSE